MATRYWVGGTGSWTSSSTTNWSASSGGAGGASAPTSIDDVIFNSSSNATAYTVTVSTGAVCRSITVAGPASGNVTFAGTVAWSIYGSFTLPATGITWSNTSAITFASTATGNTITTNGIGLANGVTFNGAGGAWTFGSAATNTGNWALTNGSVSTGNFNISGSNLTISANSNTKSLTLGSSTVTVSNFTNSSTGNFTFSAGTSTLTMSNVSSSLAGNGLTFYNVTFSNAGMVTPSITGANTYNNLTIPGRTTASGAVNFSINGNQTINGNFTVNAGTSSGFRNYIFSSTIGNPVSFTVTGTTTLTDVDFRDINNTGTTWTGTRLGNCGGNSGITFPAAKTVYWYSTAGLSGSWANAANWALSAAGVSISSITSSVISATVTTASAHGLSIGSVFTLSGATPSVYNGTYVVGAVTTTTFSYTLNSTYTGSASVVGSYIYLTGTGATVNFPLAQDTAIIPGSTTQLVNGGTITVNSTNGPFNLPAIDMSARNSSSLTMTLAFGTQSPTVYGNFTFNSNVTLTSTGTLSFASRSGQTITTGSGNFPVPVVFSGAVTLADNITVSGSVNHNYGTLTSANTFICNGFTSNNGLTRAWTLASSSFSMSSGNWTVSSTGLTVNSAPMSISLFGAGSQSFTGGGLTTYNILYLGGGYGTPSITDSNTFTTFSSANAASLTFTAGTTTTATNFVLSNDINFSGSQYTTIGSTGSAFTLAKAGGGVVRANFISLSNCTGSPISTFSAANSNNGGGNTNWTFEPLPKGTFLQYF